MVGLETIIVRHYEVLNLTTQDGERFSSWEAANGFYERECKRNPQQEIKLVAVVCESWSD